MVCLYCGSATQVTNSRLKKATNQVWRRRSCLACGNNFTTYETVELEHSIVVRYGKQGRKLLRPLVPDLLFVSIYEACKHRAHAVTDARELSQTALNNLRKHCVRGGVIERDDIVLTVERVLENFDQTAMAVYKAFHPLEA